MVFSGIIATILGITATRTKVAGRERRVHHSKSLPLLLTEERFFLSGRKVGPGAGNKARKQAEFRHFERFSRIPLGTFFDYRIDSSRRNRADIPSAFRAIGVLHGRVT